MTFSRVRSLAFLAFSFSSLAGCSSADEGSLSSPTSPEGAIGEVESGHQLCAGVLVGRNEVLTAASCVSDVQPASITFRLSQSTMAPGDDASVEPGQKVQGVRLEANGTVARLTLASAEAGGLAEGAPSTGSAVLVSFQGEEGSPVTTASCTLNPAEGFVTHDCTSGAFAPGSALLQDGRVVGIHLGTVNGQGVGFALTAPLERAPAMNVSTLSPQEHSNRNEVRANVAAGGWQVIWGDLINEADVATGALAAITGTFAAWVDYQIQAQIDAFSRSAGDAGVDVIKQALKQAFNNGEIRVSNKLGVKAGLVTYNRWERVVWDEPVCNWRGCKMKRREKRIPLPNNHQPYAAFRLF